MKRFRWLNFYVDTARNGVRASPHDSDPMVVSGAVGSVAFAHGLSDIQRKYSRWLDVSPPDICAPVVYHELLREVESAYVHGDPFPALTAACCLGERLLNHLVVEVRHEFRSSQHYRKVHKKGSIENWSTAIKILCDWGILDVVAARGLRSLLELRNPAVHFGDMTDRTARAKRAVQLVYDVTSQLFGNRSKLWFVCQGEFYLTNASESSPLARHFIVPHCHRVGYRHFLDRGRLIDAYNYENREITDEEFVARRKAYLGSPSYGRVTAEDAGE